MFDDVTFDPRKEGRLHLRNDMDEQRSAGKDFLCFLLPCHKDNGDTADRCHRG